MDMARSYEFTKELDIATLQRAVDSTTRNSGFNVRHLPDRSIATYGLTEYRITTFDIGETGPQNPMYDRLRNALKSAAGVTHG